VAPGVNKDEAQQPNNIEGVKVKVAKVKGFIFTTQDTTMTEASKTNLWGKKGPKGSCQKM
jgi:hypothetical protein